MLTDPKWRNALQRPDSIIKEFGSTLVVSYVEDSICVINSVDLNDQPFHPRALRHLRQLIVTHNAVILASSLHHIAAHLLDKYGLRYNSNKDFYYKGITWAE